MVREVRLGGSTWDAQVVQVAVGRMQAVADFTQWHVVDELAEYHAYKWLKKRLERLSPSAVL